LRERERLREREDEREVERNDNANHHHHHHNNCTITFFSSWKVLGKFLENSLKTYYTIFCSCVVVVVGIVISLKSSGVIDFISSKTHCPIQWIPLLYPLLPFSNPNIPFKRTPICFLHWGN
jgi:hypothetical protein